MADANWFYSSLAQSAATIIGIIAGFLVTGVLRQRAMTVDARRALLLRARAFDALIQPTIQPLVDVVAPWDRHIEALEDESDGLITFTFPALKGLDGSGIQGPLAVTLSASDREELRKFRAAVMELIVTTSDKYFAYLLRGDEGARTQLHSAVRFVGLRAQHLEEMWKDRPDQLGLLTRGGLERMLTFKRTADVYLTLLDASRKAAVSPSFYWALGLLAFLSVFGVVAPLSVLDARSVGERTIFLVLFATGLTGILLFLWLQLRSIIQTLHIDPDAVDSEPVG